MHDRLTSSSSAAATSSSSWSRSSGRPSARLADCVHLGARNDTARGAHTRAGARLKPDFKRALDARTANRRPGLTNRDMHQEPSFFSLARDLLSRSHRAHTYVSCFLSSRFCPPCPMQRVVSVFRVSRVSDPYARSSCVRSLPVFHDGVSLCSCYLLVLPSLYYYLSLTSPILLSSPSFHNIHCDHTKTREKSDRRARVPRQG